MFDRDLRRWIALFETAKPEVIHYDRTSFYINPSPGLLFQLLTKYGDLRALSLNHNDIAVANSSEATHFSMVDAIRNAAHPSAISYPDMDISWYIELYRRSIAVLDNGRDYRIPIEQWPMALRRAMRGAVARLKVVPMNEMDGQLVTTKF